MKTDGPQNHVTSHVTRCTETGRVTYTFNPSDIIAHAHQFGAMFCGDAKTDAANFNELVEMYRPVALENMPNHGLCAIRFRDESGVFIGSERDSAICVAYERGKFEKVYVRLKRAPSPGLIHSILHDPGFIDRAPGLAMVKTR